MWSKRYEFSKFNSFFCHLNNSQKKGPQLFAPWAGLARATDLWASGQVSSHAGVGAHGHLGPECGGAATHTAVVAGGEGNGRGVRENARGKLAHPGAHVLGR